MAAHVDTYVDEWRATLEDPVKLRRFATFVNAPDVADPDLAYVTERGQRRPATAAERGARPVTPGAAAGHLSETPASDDGSRAVLVAGPRLEVFPR